MQNTLSGVSHIFGTHEETDVESDHEEKTPPVWQKWCQPSSKEETARQRARHMDTNFDAWQCKKIAKGLPGWAARDTMISDLPEHGKVQPNHPDPVKPPLEYMRDHQVFEGIHSDIYDLCRFYTLVMMGDPPEFPTPQEPMTHGQI